MLIELCFSDAYAREDLRLLEIDDAVWADYGGDIYKFIHGTVAKCYACADMRRSLERYFERHNIEHKWLDDDASVILNCESKRPPQYRRIRDRSWKRSLKAFFQDPKTAELWHCEDEVESFLKHYDDPSALMYAERILDAAYKIDDDGYRWGLGFDQDDLLLCSIYKGKENNG